MRLAPSHIIGCDGRLWEWNDNTQQLEPNDYPRFIPNSDIISLPGTRQRLAITEEGQLYNITTKRAIQLDYRLKYIEADSEAITALTVDGIVLSIDIQSQVERIASNVGHIMSRDSEVLEYINRQGRCMIVGDFGRVDDEYNFNPDDIVQVHDNVILTNDKLVTIYLRGESGYTRLPEGIIPVCMATVRTMVESNLRNNYRAVVTMILDTNGQFHVLNGHPKSWNICDSSLVIEMNRSRKWIRMIPTENDIDSVTIINEVGESYLMSGQFLIKPTSIPREVFTSSIPMLKNARTVQT